MKALRQSLAMFALAAFAGAAAAESNEINVAQQYGVSFLPLLEGKPHTPRKYVFVERGPHGQAPVTVNMTNSDFRRTDVTSNIAYAIDDDK